MGIPNIDRFRSEHDRSIGLDVRVLFDTVNAATDGVKEKLTEIKVETDQISIGQMFEMQMLMNNLAQLSEMSTSVVSASHTTISSMARNVKG